MADTGTGTFVGGPRFEAVKALGLEANFEAFATHVLASGADEYHPNLAQIDLMRIPSLVPNIYIIDFRNGIEDGLLMKFAGTAVEENYPSPLQGNYLDKVYTGHDSKELLMNIYRNAYLNAESFFTRRVVRYLEAEEEDKYRLATVLFIVCYADSGAVDYGIGCAKYEFAREKVEAAFTNI